MVLMGPHHVPGRPISSPVLHALRHRLPLDARTYDGAAERPYSALSYNEISTHFRVLPSSSRNEGGIGEIHQGLEGGNRERASTVPSAGSSAVALWCATGPRRLRLSSQREQFAAVANGDISPNLGDIDITLAAVLQIDDDGWCGDVRPFLRAGDVDGTHGSIKKNLQKESSIYRCVCGCTSKWNGHAIDARRNTNRLLQIVGVERGFGWGREE